MRPFRKNISEITEVDLQRLIGTVAESDSIDFKEDAYTPPPQKASQDAKDKWRKELCADLTAFANAHGGWIVCGMTEQEGTANGISGLGMGVNVDGEILRLDQTAQSGIEPPIPRLGFRSIALQDTAKGQVILIRIPRSFAAPHRVKETGRFHIRRSNGKS